MTRANDLLLLEQNHSRSDAEEAVRIRRRPEVLQRILNGIGESLLADDSPIMAKRTAGRVFHKLMHAEPLHPSGKTMPAALQAMFNRSLKKLEKAGPLLGALASDLKAMDELLRWSPGRSGPYAGRSFEAQHSHAIIVGPGGLEERQDLRVGLTLMAPYCRFPDHQPHQARAYLALSSSEFCVGADGWEHINPGAVFFVNCGEWIALRCISGPFSWLGAISSAHRWSL